MHFYVEVMPMALQWLQCTSFHASQCMRKVHSISTLAARPKKQGRITNYVHEVVRYKIAWSRLDHQISYFFWKISISHNPGDVNVDVWAFGGHQDAILGRVFMRKLFLNITEIVIF